MPHLFVNRPRLYDVVGKDPSLRDQFRWETINAVVYKLGGIVFIAGSVLFFPSMADYAISARGPSSWAVATENLIRSFGA